MIYVRPIDRWFTCRKLCFFCTSTSMLVSRRWANYKWRRYGGNSSSMTLLVWILSGWWFQTFFIVHNIWDNPSHWIVFFRGVETIHPPTSQRLFGGLQHLPGSVPGFNPKLFWGSPQTHGLGSHLTLLRAIFFEGLKRLCTKVLVRVILAAGATSTLGAMLHVSGICTPPGWLSPGRQPPNLRTVGCPALVAEHPYKTILPSSSRFGIIMILQSPNWVLLPSGRTPWLHLSGQHQRRLQSPSTLGGSSITFLGFGSIIPPLGSMVMPFSRFSRLGFQPPPPHIHGVSLGSLRGYLGVYNTFLALCEASTQNPFGALLKPTAWAPTSRCSVLFFLKAKTAMHKGPCACHQQGPCQPLVLCYMFQGPAETTNQILWWCPKVVDHRQKISMICHVWSGNQSDWAVSKCQVLKRGLDYTVYWVFSQSSVNRGN